MYKHVIANITILEKKIKKNATVILSVTVRVIIPNVITLSTYL